MKQCHQAAAAYYFTAASVLSLTVGCQRLKWLLKIWQCDNIDNKSKCVKKLENYLNELCTEPL